MNLQLLWYQFEDFEAFREFFVGMQQIYQILAFIGLVAITIGAILLVYYIVKQSFIFVFNIFKWMFRGTKSFVKSASHDFRRDKNFYQTKNSAHYSRPIPPHPSHLPHPPQPPRVPQPPAPPLSPRPPTPPQVPLPPMPSPARIESFHRQNHRDDVLHCPMCGEKFTKDMMNLLNREERVFCEYCGRQLEYIVQ